jgi:cell division protein FtsN
VPQRVASVAPASAPVPAATDAPIGGFSVQIGVRPSESEARAAFAQMQQKYAALGGQPALIRKAEVNGNTLYRVRVGPLSKEDASSLCAKLQGSGGQCFVTKN